MNKCAIKKLVLILCFTILPFEILMLINRKNITPEYTALAYILVILTSFFVLKLTKQPAPFSFRVKNIRMTFTKGWYVFAASFLFAVLNFLSIDLTNGPTHYQLALFIINTALCVTFEEIVFRGMIQNLLLESYRNCKKSAWKAIRDSSLIFAFMHILNLIGSPHYILGTAAQVVYTFCLGMILGTVYYFSQCIWCPVILHFIFNILGNYVSLFSAASPSSDLPVSGAVIEIAIMLPCALIAAAIYRRKEKR